MNESAKGARLHELIEAQVGRTPGAPAVVDEHGSLSYEGLDRRAERLANRLRGVGVGEDVAVGIYMERCAEYVVACLAALKAGGAFLPLEMAYPPALISDVLDDSRPPVVLTRRRYEGDLPQGQARFLLDDGWEGEASEPSSQDGAPQPDAGSLAFVSYSSGTTGKPKGISNSHEAAVRSYRWRFGVSDYEPGDRVACNVFFIWEVFRPLLRGATVYVIPDDAIHDPPALVGFLGRCRATETLVTPSLLGSVLDWGGPSLSGRLGALRTLWLNGEVVTKTLARRAAALLPGTRLLNVYSASETHEVAAGDLRALLVGSSSATYCPVGPPRDPEHTYVLDAAGRPVPGGEPGELYVGGDGLARGYVNLPEKTAERFLKDPFRGEPGARMYRTGDRARLLPDGNLEVMGRVDSMVKVRGYSIELGAVEAAIEETLAVGGVVVVAEGEEGEDKRLVAYLLPNREDPAGRFAGWSIEPETGLSPGIRHRLQGSLPHYMIPAVFVEVETLPLQETTGKVDRKRLPPPPPRTAAQALTRADEGQRPRSVGAGATRAEKEVFLARTWEAVLGLRAGDVGRDDDFFDLGGHSLAAAELSGRVEDAFGARVSMREFLEDPTVSGLCDRIEARKRGGAAVRPTRHPREATQALADAVLEKEISPKASASGAATTLRGAGCVFLTGATGFLGAFLLDALLSRTEAEVRCLVRPREGSRGGARVGAADPLSPIRENLEGYGLWRAEHAGRVVAVAGDLAENRLGMSERVFDALAGEVDAIFHAGALVNLLYPYPQLKPANVGGTREVLRLACRHGATPVHHVSTNGIFPPRRPWWRPQGRPEGRVWGEDADLDALAGSREDGYGLSKWVGEKLVREAARRGLPVCVYRPGNVSGHSVTGASNPRDTLGSVLVESLRLGAAPRIEGWRVEMTPVDFVSAAICHIADGAGSFGRTFHLADPDPVPAENVFAWLEDAGYDLDRLDYPDWTQALREAHREDAYGFAAPESGLRGLAPEPGELWDGNVYDDANVRAALRDGGPQGRPGIDASLIATYAGYFARRGWVAPAEGSKNGRGRRSAVRAGAQRA